MDTGGVKAALRAVNQYKYALAVLLFGVLLMLLPARRQETQQDRTERTTVYDRAAAQKEIETALAAIDGVGALRLVLSVEGSEQRELAEDASLSYSGSRDAPEDYSRRSDTVVLGSGSGASVVVTREIYPRCTGALVVCEGGGSASVRLAVTQALSALTGLSSDRIAVVSGKPS